MKKLNILLIIIIAITNINYKIFSVGTKRKLQDDTILFNNKRQKKILVAEKNIKECAKWIKKTINNFNSSLNKENDIIESFEILKKFEDHYKIDWSYILAFISNNYNFTKSMLEKNKFNNVKSKNRHKNIFEPLHYKNTIQNDNTIQRLIKTENNHKSILIVSKNEYPINICIKENNINSVKAFLDYNPEYLKRTTYDNYYAEILLYSISKFKWDIANLILDRLNPSDIIDLSCRYKINSFNTLIKIITRYNLKEATNLFYRIAEKIDLYDPKIQDYIEKVFDPTIPYKINSIFMNLKFDNATAKREFNIKKNNLFFDIISEYKINIYKIISLEISYNKIPKIINHIDLASLDHIRTIFHGAIEANNYNLVKYLATEYRFNINMLNNKNQNGMHLVKSLKMAKLLIKHKIDLNQQDILGNTPLMHWSIKDPNTLSSRLMQFAIYDNLNELIDITLSINSESLIKQNINGDTIVHLVYTEILNLVELENNQNMAIKLDKIYNIILYFSVNHPLKNKIGLNPNEILLTDIASNILNNAKLDAFVNTFCEYALNNDMLHTFYKSMYSFLKIPHLNIKTVFNFAPLKYLKNGVYHNKNQNIINFIALELIKSNYCIDLIKNEITNIDLNQQNQINKLSNYVKDIIALININNKNCITPHEDIWSRYIEDLIKSGKEINEIINDLDNHLKYLIECMNIYLIKYNYDSYVLNKDNINLNNIELEIKNRDIKRQVDPLVLAHHIDNAKSVDIIKILIKKGYKPNIIEYIKTKSPRIESIIKLYPQGLQEQAHLSGENNLTTYKNPLYYAIKHRDPNLVKKIIIASESMNLSNNTESIKIQKHIHNTIYKNKNEIKILNILRRYQIIKMLFNGQYNEENIIPTEISNLIAHWSIALEEQNFLEYRRKDTNKQLKT